MCRHAGNGAFVFFLWKYIIRKRNSIVQTVLCFLAVLLFAGMGVTYCFIWPNETTITVSENAIEIDGPDAMTIPMSKSGLLRLLRLCPKRKTIRAVL